MRPAYSFMVHEEGVLVLFVLPDPVEVDDEDLRLVYLEESDRKYVTNNGQRVLKTTSSRIRSSLNLSMMLVERRSPWTYPALCSLSTPSCTAAVTCASETDQFGSILGYPEGWKAVRPGFLRSIVSNNRLPSSISLLLPIL